MESVTEKKSVGQVAELDAEVVNQALSVAGPQGGSVEFILNISLFDQRGAFINWFLPPGYAVGSNDTIYLSDGTTKIKSWSIKEKAGSIDTGTAWKEGLSASYWAIDYAGQNRWVQLMTTGKT